MLLQKHQSGEQKQAVEVKKGEKQLSIELHALGELTDELIRLKENGENHCCKAKNLLHIYQGVLELQGIDVSKKIEGIVEALDAGINESNWTTLDRILLDMYKLVFLLC